jgi:prepilin-type N-terminal cleavage/methylation domain-containing protein
MFLQKNNSKGFTLIELLVVIAIIGVLAGVILVSLDNGRVKTRNARRNSDIKQLVHAFNLGYTNSFPGGAGAAAGACVSVQCYGSWSIYVADTAVVDPYLAPYMSSKPSDPSGGTRDYGGYLYINPWSGVSPYDGYSFPSGPSLHWGVELPVSSISCGPGRIWSLPASGFIECVLRLD